MNGGRQCHVNEEIESTPSVVLRLGEEWTWERGLELDNQQLIKSC